MQDPLFILCTILAAAGLAEWLSGKPFFRHLGGALLVIVIVATLANIGVVPTFANAPPVYGHLLSIGAPVSIFLLLLNVHLAALTKAGGPMLLAFGLGGVGTVAGVTLSAWATGSSQWLGEFAAPFTGMFVATYTGGGANFNALALHYNVMEQGVLFAGANAVDNLVTAIWMASLLVIPAILRRLAPNRTPHKTFDAQEDDTNSSHADLRPDLFSLSVLLAMALSAHWLSLLLAQMLSELGMNVPSVLILTTLALAAAQFRKVRQLEGAQMLGTYGAYLFLAVIGAFCDLSALAGLGTLGLQLLAFVGLAVAIHGAVVFGIGLATKMDPDLLAVASTANVGGATTVMPLARSLGRNELLLPGILVGSLGNAVGTYLGFTVVRLMM
ncbi:MAG: DUF819 family protein [Halioglobus sp.]